MILGHLAQFASFAAQSEVLCTQGLVHLLDKPEARACFAREIRSSAGVEVPDDLLWRAEVPQADGGRPDLEGATRNGVPLVKVEAKLGAPFSRGQLRSYIQDLVDRGSGSGVLLVLVPRARVGEAQREISLAFQVHGSPPWRPAAYPGITIALISWEQVLAALDAEGMQAPSGCDLAQLNAMYRVLSGQHIEPLASIEELLAWRERPGGFMQLVDRVTRKLSPSADRLNPIGVESVSGEPEGLEPRGYYRRHLCPALGDQRPCYSIGVRDPFQGHVTPIWMRFHRQTPQFSLIRRRLAGLHWVESAGHIWIPLAIPLNAGDDQMVEALISGAEEIIRVAYAPVTRTEGAERAQ